MSSQAVLTELNHELARLYIVRSDTRDKMKGENGARFNELLSILLDIDNQIKDVENKIKGY